VVKTNYAEMLGTDGKLVKEHLRVTDIVATTSVGNDLTVNI
jgi:hypothetical protein